MKFKTQLECMDNECRAIMFGHFLEGMKCVKCGGPTIERPYNPIKKQVEQDKSRELTIQVHADTTEALKQMKEVTEAANECVAALEKLEKVMGKFAGESKSIEVNPKIGLVLDDKVIGESIGQRIDEMERIKVRMSPFYHD
ncbi:hypothetical protein U2I54_22545 [Bacillus pseudomycoides]|uniref:Uncharacterized protein n=1 Tax=Bacillus bingmayongensis TaxID=1150157 RepID=A0ABU5K2W8_9BACI|nr:hypothetical protein [Bacillus pseudomycoides]